MGNNIHFLGCCALLLGHLLFLSQVHVTLYIREVDMILYSLNSLNMVILESLLDRSIITVGHNVNSRLLFTFDDFRANNSSNICEVFELGLIHFNNRF
jgi:hypothetical protein